MNIANKLTIWRIILTVFFLPFLLWWHNIWWTKLVSLIIFSLAAISDYLDGWIAKKKNMVTDFGKLWDPIADKILVLSAFAAFLQMGLMNIWMFMVIISREILITSLRLFALNKGKVLSASRAGKHKTVSQMIVIFLVLIFLTFQEIMKTFFTWNPAWENIFRQGISVLMLITVGLTFFSGISYLWENRQLITKI